jgi:hypothetical protein
MPSSSYIQNVVQFYWIQLLDDLPLERQDTSRIWAFYVWFPNSRAEAAFCAFCAFSGIITSISPN